MRTHRIFLFNISSWIDITHGQLSTKQWKKHNAITLGREHVPLLRCQARLFQIPHHLRCPATSQERKKRCCFCSIMLVDRNVIVCTIHLYEYQNEGQEEGVRSENTTRDLHFFQALYAWSLQWTYKEIRSEGQPSEVKRKVTYSKVKPRFQSNNNSWFASS